MRRTADFAWKVREFFPARDPIGNYPIRKVYRC